MTPQTRAGAVRSHWVIRNSLHRVSDVTFGKDKARSRTGYGPANMATVRHCAFNILKATDDTRSLKTVAPKLKETRNTRPASPVRPVNPESGPWRLSPPPFRGRFGAV
jgi:hypothetical protein